MKKKSFEEIVQEGNIIVVDEIWIALCKTWKPEVHNLFTYLYLHIEENELMIGSHFTIGKEQHERIRLANKKERLQLFESMFKHGIALNKEEHHLIGNLL